MKRFEYCTEAVELHRLPHDTSPKDAIQAVLDTFSNQGWRLCESITGFSRISSQPQVLLLFERPIGAATQEDIKVEKTTRDTSTKERVRLEIDLGIEPDDKEPWNKVIPCVKVVKETTGWGLKESKDLVDEARTGGTLVSPQEATQLESALSAAGVKVFLEPDGAPD